ncbi:Uncharacterised protein [Mycolicibacterium vanbaalenii]|uniref:Uncharacterized protein n=1 Tax=Mycolicibacterium vanbaalenii TaxID=110539 RepID=A0A5S9R3W0_MYCVN|nr:hypothetical protein [Mycolicibacterium vanbaalenii]CAA0129296.1 Uncharacterised protein [Mycolicibacterium vanbaalenii]
MTIDREALNDEFRSEIEKLLRSGMPDLVVEGYMKAKVRTLADRHSAEQWRDLRAYVDEVGEQAHQGDPVKKARVDHFNDMFIAELKKRQGV